MDPTQAEYLTYLEVDGAMIPDAALAGYCLRWLASGEPVLYHDGRRVTARWCMILDATILEDPHGSSA